MKRCRTCLYPDTKPDLHFDETGECSACRSFKNRPTIDWDARHRELLALLDRHDGRVIVPSSGGKDSTYIALRLKELGADVTAVTATTCHLTSIGRHNLDNLAKHVRTIEVTPNMSVRAKLNRMGLELVGDISWPEHASIFSVPFRMSRHLGIPLIMYGENPQNAYGGPPGSDEARQMTRRWVTEFGGFLGLRPSDFIGQEGITASDMRDYELPPDIGECEAHFLGQYEPWDSHRNMNYAREHGMHQINPCMANWWKGENLDNAQTGIHDHQMYRKYGFCRAVAQLSVDVRMGLISRSTAMDFIRRNGGAFPWIYAGVHVDEVCERLGITLKELKSTLDRFTNWSLFSTETGWRPVLKEFSECSRTA